MRWTERRGVVDPLGERGHWPGKRGINRHPDHQSDGRKNRETTDEKGYHYLSEQWDR